MARTVLVIDELNEGLVTSILLQENTQAEVMDSVASAEEALYFMEDAVTFKRVLPEFLVLNLANVHALELLQEIRNHAAIDHKKIKVILFRFLIENCELKKLTTLDETGFFEKPSTVSEAIEILRKNE